MMNLNLMKQFFDSVDAEWQSPIANEIASQWFQEDFQAYCIRASANFAFLVKTGEQKHLLRFNHADERQVEFIGGELEFIEHLAQNSVRVARPRASLNGKLIESIETSMGIFHSSLFEYLPGEHLELDSLDDASIKLWGQLLGKIHRTSQGFNIKGRLNHHGLLDLVRQIIPRSHNEVWQEAAMVEEKLQALPRTESNYGLIHFDFEPDNLAWEDGKVGTFDLDDCAYGWFAMDIANALGSELFGDHLERFTFADRRFESFVEVYRLEHTISDEELNWIPLFLRLDNLYAYARNYRSSAEEPTGVEPQWTTDLRHKLRNKLVEFQENFRDYPIQDFI